MPAANPTDYRPHLDGLRALAVYLVVLYHSDLSAFSHGFIRLAAVYPQADRALTDLANALRG